MKFNFAELVDSLGTVPFVGASQYADWNDTELFELWLERCAIMTFDGGLTTKDTEYESSQLLIVEIGEKRFARIASNARSRCDSPQDTPEKSDVKNSKFAFLKSNGTTKWLPDAQTPDSPSTQLSRS